MNQRSQTSDASLFAAQLSRRMFLGHYAGSLGALALAHLTGSQVVASDAQSAERAGPMLRGKAKNVICLFQHGGPSQMDLFDPKPALNKYHGQPYPGGNVEAHFDKQKGNVLGSPFKFQK